MAAPANVVAGVLEVALQIAADIKSLTSTKADKTNVVDLLTAQTVAGIKTFTSPPAVLPLPTLSSNGQLTHKKYVDDLIANVTAGTGSTTVPVNYVPLVDRDVLNLGYSRRSTYMIPKEELQNYVTSDSDAVKLAAIANNTSKYHAALKAYPNRVIEFDPSTGEAWPIQSNVDGLDTTTWGTQIPVRVKGKFKQPVGTFQTQAEADAYKVNKSNPNGRVPAAAVFEVGRAWGAPQAITSIGYTMFGPNLPPWYQPSQKATKLVLGAATGYSGWKIGDQAVICSNDSYDAAVRAGYADNNVWKAQYLEVNAIGVDVANYTTSAASSANVAAGRSALNYNGTNNGMESRMVKGGTSNVQALVRGDTGNSQLLFVSVPAAFTVGEQLIDVQTNQPIGTVALQYLVTPGKLLNQYSTTPVIRKVPTNLPIVMDVEIECEVDPSAKVIPGYNRSPEIGFTGTYDHSLRIKITSGTGRGVVFTSAKRGVANITVSGLPNHALENELSEDAYGYGAGTFGCTDDILFNMDVENVRHGFTTNLVGGKWNLAATGSTDNTNNGINSTNYRKYGTTRNCTVQGSFRYTFGAGIDTHEAAESLIFRNFQIIKPFWGGRVLSAGVGINTRGFNTLIENGYIQDVATGITDGSQQVASGYPGSHTRVRNVIVDGFQANGFSQGSPSVNYVSAETTIEDCIFRGDPTILNTEYYQAGLLLNYGQVLTKGIVVEAVNGCMIIHKGTSSTDTPKRRGGTGIHINPVFDFTDSNANTTIRYEAHMDVAAVLGMTIIANGGSRPASIFRHEIDAPETGQLPTNVQWDAIRLVQANSVAATPSLHVIGAQVPASTATNTRLRSPGDLVLPTGGTTGQVLRKKSNADGDFEWATISSGGSSLPVGGSTGQILRKSSATDGDAAWAWAASATKVNVDGVYQGTLDIDSSPPIKIVSVDADVPGPASGTLVQDVSVLQTTLPAGTYDVEATVIYSMTSGTAGSPRLGIGGAGSSAATLPTGLITSTQGTSAAGPPGSRFWITTLGVAGAAAVFPSAAGNAPTAGQNVAGVGVGSFALPISWDITTKVTLTAPGVIGIVGHVSNGGDRTMTIKAGSKIKFTRTA
jgi:hypothetical protein